MGTDDVGFICWYDGELINEDTNAKYEGGKKKLIKVPKNIGFTSFKQQIQEMTTLSIDGTEFKIKCGVKIDESTVIAVDVDDDKSLRSVMEDSKYVRTYILKDVLPATTSITAAQRVSQSNIDDHDRVKLSRAEELFNLSDISQEGMSSYLYKKMDSLMGNHEHSEGSEVNMPEKWHVKSNVDDHQIILSGSSHSSTLDEMLYKANQVSSQVSRCSQSSVPSQLSNPLIRNREDNEADKGNRQDSVVVNDIQFTFQRKETILSSHRSAPMRTFDRFPNSNVVPLDKGMTNRSVSNHEVNEGNEDMVHEENGYTCQVEQMVPPSEAAIDSSDICVAVGKESELELSGLKPHYNDGMNMNKSSSLSQSQLREWFPEKLVPFITGSENPVGDGNCGFRALCMALGRNDDTWPSIRAELVKEIESKKDFYSLLFGDEKMKLVERIWHLEGLAPCTKWMDMPSTGFVFAEAFKVILVHYSKKNCWTFVPSLTLPNADSANVEVLGIGLVENNHFVKLDFRYGCPLPPFPHTPSNWRTISSGIVNSWEELLAPRLRACMLMNIAGLLFGQCIAEMVIIDREDPVLHTAAFIDGTHNNHLVNGHRDLNCIDISGEDMKSSEDMHHRFSQPNADHRDGGIDFSIRAHEHREDNEVNVPENAVCEENQVISQMEQNVLPSDADIGSRDKALGREFPDIDALRNALSDMAVMTGREYKHVRTSPSKLKMKCKAEDCNWCIQATRSSNSGAFKVVKYEEVHSCMVRTSSGDKDHPQATVRWILSKVQSSMEKDPNMEPSKIVKEMKDRYGVLISYNKAVKAKTKALEVMRGWLMSSLPDLDICRALKVEWERDSTAICKLGVNSDGDSFQYFFWAFQACIDALRNHLRPVVYVASRNTEAGVLMYARGVDGDSFHGNLIEVGFGYYYNYREDEKCSMWETYLGWLKEFVLPPITEAAVEGIPFSIVTDLDETGGLTGAVENVLPHLHHFFTPLSVASYFSKKFEGDGLLTLCHLACRTYSTEKCESYLQEIKTRNKEAYSWLLSSSVEPKSHWAIAFSPNKHVTELFYWGVGLWGSGIKEKRSVVEMVECSREMVANYFSERRREGEEAATTTTTTTGLTPRVIKGVQGLIKYLADYYKVESIDGRKYRIRIEYPTCEDEDVDEDEDEDEDVVVDLEEKSCTCGKFQAREYPCGHALVAIVHLNLDVRNYINLRWHSLDTYLKTYAGILPPPISHHISQWQTASSKIPHLPPKRTGVGRPPKLQKVSV